MTTTEKITIATNIVTVIVVFVSPIIAIQVQVYLDRKREIKKRKLGIFKTLMGTRMSRLSVNHVDALNMIDLEFDGKDKNESKVIEAWNKYRTHLFRDNRGLDEEKMKAWQEEGLDLFVVLLDKMAKCLDYDFDSNELKRNAYAPIAYEDEEKNQRLLREGMLQILFREQALRVALEPNSSQPQKNNP
jgi:hypothetical protein